MNSFQFEYWTQNYIYANIMIAFSKDIDLSMNVNHQGIWIKYFRKLHCIKDYKQPNKLQLEFQMLFICEQPLHIDFKSKHLKDLHNEQEEIKKELIQTKQELDKLNAIKDHDKLKQKQLEDKIEYEKKLLKEQLDKEKMIQEQEYKQKFEENQKQIEQEQMKRQLEIQKLLEQKNQEELESQNEKKLQQMILQKRKSQIQEEQEHIINYPLKGKLLIKLLNIKDLFNLQQKQDVLAEEEKAEIYIVIKVDEQEQKSPNKNFDNQVAFQSNEVPFQIDIKSENSFPHISLELFLVKQGLISETYNQGILQSFSNIYDGKINYRVLNEDIYIGGCTNYDIHKLVHKPGISHIFQKDIINLKPNTGMIMKGRISVQMSFELNNQQMIDRKLYEQNKNSVQSVTSKRKSVVKSHSFIMKETDKNDQTYGESLIN